MKRARTFSSEKLLITNQFLNDDLINNNIVPFLDPWSIYNLRQVCSQFRNCVKVKKKYALTPLSFLSEHFYDLKRCCICFEPCRSGGIIHEHGYYCHSACAKESNKKYIYDDANIVLTKRRKLSSSSTSRFFKGPYLTHLCSNGSFQTMESLALSNNEPLWSMYFKEKKDRMLQRYHAFFTMISKRKQLCRIYNTNKKIRIGNQYIRMNRFIDEKALYGQSVEEARDVLVQKENTLIQVHRGGLDYFSRHIKGRMFICHEESTIQNWVQFYARRIHPQFISTIIHKTETELRMEMENALFKFNSAYYHKSLIEYGKYLYRIYGCSCTYCTGHVYMHPYQWTEWAKRVGRHKQNLLLVLGEGTMMHEFREQLREAFCKSVDFIHKVIHDPTIRPKFESKTNEFRDLFDTFLWGLSDVDLNRVYEQLKKHSAKKVMYALRY